jgi:mannose-6-phosphate isomerase-like protein (cupin superfamily)
MTYLGRIDGPKTEDILKKLSGKYPKIKGNGLEKKIEEEEQSTIQKAVLPVFMDDSGNPLYCYQNGGAPIFHFLEMEERAQLGDDFKRQSVAVFRPRLDINFRVKNGLTIVDDGVIVDSNYDKPYGFYATMKRNEECTTKLVGLYKLNDERSIQCHEHRDEKWLAVSGLLAVYRGKLIEPAGDYNANIKTIANMTETIIQPGDTISIPRGTAHTARNLVKDGSTFVEIATGHSAEHDVVRLYDKNGRVKLPGVPDGLTAPEVIAYAKKLMEG